MKREILWLESITTGKEFPTTQDSADTDMDWDGYAPLTSKSGEEIVMSKIRPEEINNPELFAARTNKELNRRDLERIELLRAVTCKPRKGEHFQEFLKRSESFKEQFYYKDLFDPSGEAIQTRKEALSDYTKNGGRINYYPEK